MKSNANPDKISANLIFNFLGKSWSVFSVYAFVPIYIKILGQESYGLIAFHSLILSLLWIVDCGLSASFAREAARLKSRKSLLDTLVSVERVLIAILLPIGFIFIFFAEYISKNWLRSVDYIDANVLVHSLRLMPISIVPQILISLYIGGLMGLEKQVLANLLNTIFSVFRSGAVILPLFKYPDVRIFFIWIALVSIIMACVIRSAFIYGTKNSLLDHDKSECEDNGRFSISVLVGIREYAIGMFGMSIIAGLNNQIDKIVVSKMLSLAKFSQYSLASTLSQIPYIVTLPIATAVLPRFIRMIGSNEVSSLSKVYQISNFWISLIGSYAGMFIICFTDDILFLWLDKVDFDRQTLIGIRILSLGSIFLSFQLAVYHLSIAYGHTKTNLKFGCIVLIISVPTQILLTSHYGIVGATVPWLLLNILAFVFLGVTLNRRFPLISIKKYFFNDTLSAFFLASIIMVSAKLVSQTLNFGLVGKTVTVILFSALLGLSKYRKTGSLLSPAGTGA
jgi:O-antigen/teichoic acid export membrane protein